MKRNPFLNCCTELFEVLQFKKDWNVKREIASKKIKMKNILFFTVLFFSIQLVGQTPSLKLTATPVLKLKTANDSVQYALGGEFIVLNQWNY